VHFVVYMLTYHSWIALYLWVIGYTKASNSKSDLQTHSRSLAVTPFVKTNMISYLSSIITIDVSILHRLRDIMAYYPKLKDVTWPWLQSIKGQFLIPMLNHRMANHCTKFKVSSCSHSGDILGRTKNLNGSHDHNHAPFMDGLSSVGWEAMIKLCTKFEVSTFTHYKDAKVMKNAKIGVVWGVRGHPRAAIVNITIREYIYFLFDFNRNYTSILYHFRVIAIIRLKWPILTYPTCIWHSCSGWFCSSLAVILGIRRLESLGFRMALSVLSCV